MLLPLRFVLIGDSTTNEGCFQVLCRHLIDHRNSVHQFRSKLWAGAMIEYSSANIAASRLSSTQHPSVGTKKLLEATQKSLARRSHVMQCVQARPSPLSTTLSLSSEPAQTQGCSCTCAKYPVITDHTVLPVDPPLRMRATLRVKTVQLPFADPSHFSGFKGSSSSYNRAELSFTHS